METLQQCCACKRPRFPVFPLPNEREQNRGATTVYPTTVHNFRCHDCFLLSTAAAAGQNGVSGTESFEHDASRYGGGGVGGRPGNPREKTDDRARLRNRRPFPTYSNLHSYLLIFSPPTSRPFTSRIRSM